MTAESHARMVKATRMARRLLDQAPASTWLGADVASASPEWWLLVAQAAGIRSALRGHYPSPTTVDLVLDLLRTAEGRAA